jgi:hypothetical protein
MQQLARLAASPERPHQRIDHELRGHLRLHRPADDATRVQVEHHRHVQPALGGRHVGEIGHPALVRAFSGELALEQVRRDAVLLA